jgi:hypothetical protein
VGRAVPDHERVIDETALIVTRMADELLAKVPTPMEIVFQPMTILELAGLVQLALRHPGVTPDHRHTASRFLNSIRLYFSDCPAVLEVLRLGDDPAKDREP